MSLGMGGFAVRTHVLTVEPFRQKPRLKVTLLAQRCNVDLEGVGPLGSL